ncbi:MAG: hypothetical protein HYR90_01715 [Candidatus Andersenbacteria bacterium]|nr:hypothetical protein [Candidatus Andersenbacteria bacterium]MBI3250877.1 hypothetical protein [Candidatus Andersenbacteria bacterium]
MRKTWVAVMMLTVSVLVHGEDPSNQSPLNFSSDLEMLREELALIRKVNAKVQGAERNVCVNRPCHLAEWSRARRLLLQAATLPQPLQVDCRVVAMQVSAQKVSDQTRSQKTNATEEYRRTLLWTIVDTDGKSESKGLEDLFQMTEADQLTYMEGVYGLTPSGTDSERLARIAWKQIEGLGVRVDYE